jgi:hypothetical protein
LLEGAYWERFVTWVILKGMGLGVFYLVIRRSVALCTHKLRANSEELFLWAWALALVPYWILVRQGNFVHDYYFLPFFFPFAWISALEWKRLAGWSRWALLLLCCSGYLQPLSLENIDTKAIKLRLFVARKQGFLFDASASFRLAGSSVKTFLMNMKAVILGLLLSPSLTFALSFGVLSDAGKDNKNTRLVRESMMKLPCVKW